MTIRVECQCGKKFRAKDEHAGKRTKCPGCGRSLTVGAAEATPPSVGQVAKRAVPERLRNVEPWKVVAGSVILIGIVLAPLLLTVFYGQNRDDLTIGTLLTIVVVAIVGLGYLVCILNEPGLTFLFYFFTWFVPGYLILSGWRALLEGLGHDYSQRLPPTSMFSSANNVDAYLSSIGATQPGPTAPDAGTSRSSMRPSQLGVATTVGAKERRPGEVSSSRRVLAFVAATATFICLLTIFALVSWNVFGVQPLNHGLFRYPILIVFLITGRIVYVAIATRARIERPHTRTRDDETMAFLGDLQQRS